MVELEYRKLTDTEIATALAELRDWTIVDGKFTRLFEFKDYKSGLVFASAVGWTADELNHHPDMFVGYGKVRIETMTHDTGGLTPYDWELAKRVDRLLAKA